MATATASAAPPPQTPEEIERHWFENVYQGDRMPQLTVRAVVMGMFLGGVMACSNVYVSLKTGWSLGVAITSCILAYSIFAALHKAFPRWFPAYSILENNAMQSTASAAGTMTSAGIANAIPALMMLNPNLLPQDFAHRLMWLIPWVILISWMGVFLAVPTKRQMINIERLPFPTGTAAASTLRSLHAHGGEAARQAKSLFLALGLGGLIAWMRSAEAPWLLRTPIAWLPKWALFTEWSAPKWLPWLRYPKLHDTWGTGWLRIGTWKGEPLMLNQVTMSLEGSLLFIAAGAIISFRQAWSMLLGAVVNYGFLAPHFLAKGDIAEPTFRKISSWSLWIGVPMMVTSGLLLFFLNWRSVVRAFSTVAAFFRRRAGADPLERIEVPGSWFIFGYAVLGVAIMILGHALFGIRYWMGAVAVLATFLLVVVATRAAGETDITPVGPISKITQLTFGALAPGDVSINLMTANITAGATSHAADLLQDLKSGYLLGANPRQQFFAQFFGVLAGGLAVVPVYFILIPSVDVLGTEQWPAPAALVWRGVAELLAKGFSALPVSARYGLVIGAAIGIVLPLLEMAFPKHKKFIPSPTGLGLAFTINGFNVVSFFIGSVLALAFKRAKPKLAGQYTVPVASGIIAGESLMGVSIAFLRIFRVLG
ncbi:MAG: OPT/YSL family transporter [Candidatus Eisenbacteria bacterium]|nr:OPT/YSL family transporter [Candidatus Eisenbacteria bacterium]